MIKQTIILCILSICIEINAQYNRTHFEADDIQTVLFYPQKSPMTMPIIVLGSDDHLTLEFDEIDGNTRSLMYSFEHCDANWAKSDIIEMDFIEGFNKIYDTSRSQLSFNTTTDYVHYDVDIPTNCLKISGNYIIRIFDANSEQLLVSRPFFVSEEIIGIQSRITREGQPNNATQNISFCIQHPAIKITSPTTDLKINVWQNMRIGEAQKAEAPTFIRNNELMYEDNGKFQFEAANEGRWLDNRSLKYSQTGNAQIEYFEPFYHYTLSADGTPRGYYYHEDFNGYRYIEARDIHDSPKYAADYTFVHFTLPRQQNDADIYVYGELTNWNLTESNKMTYNEDLKAYTLTLRVKQGLHNYQYMSIRQLNNYPELTYIENSFQETENDYYIAVYYRSYADTYDRLIGFKKHNSIKTHNSFIH